MPARTASINTQLNNNHHGAPLWRQTERSPIPMKFPLSGDIPALQSRNKVLSALPEDVLARLVPHLRRVLLHQDDVLYKQNNEIKYVYFVENGMVSLVVGANSGAQIETAVIGSEGMVGALSVWEPDSNFHRAIVQIPGKALRLPVEVFQDEWKKNGHLQKCVLNYTNLLMAQISQTALCGRLHTIEERLNRWLLTSRDRIGSNVLELTHDHIAQMLGTRRPSITIALGTLQQAGLIECGRGHITLKDPHKLEEGACECYSVVRDHFTTFENGVI